MKHFILAVALILAAASAWAATRNQAAPPAEPTASEAGMATESDAAESDTAAEPPSMRNQVNNLAEPTGKSRFEWYREKCGGEAEEKGLTAEARDEYVRNCIKP